MAFIHITFDWQYSIIKTALGKNFCHSSLYIFQFNPVFGNFSTENLHAAATAASRKEVLGIGSYIVIVSHSSRIPKLVNL